VGVVYGRQWRIRTRLGWVTLRVRTPEESLSVEDPDAVQRERLARRLLSEELRANSRNPPEELYSVWRYFNGDDYAFGSRERRLGRKELVALERWLFEGSSAHQVAFDHDPFPMGELKVDGWEPALSALGPPGRQPEPDSSFIAVNLRDQDDEPVIGRRWIIDLPDGSRHEGETDAEGWARVQGFRKDGMAKVVFPGFDELDHDTQNSAERTIIPLNGADPNAAGKSGPSEHFLEFTLTAPDGSALADVAFSVTLESGEVREGRTDALGLARLDGIDGKSAALQVLSIPSE
jgi:hypothetical protein